MAEINWAIQMTTRDLWFKVKPIWICDVELQILLKIQTVSYIYMRPKARGKKRKICKFNTEYLFYFFFNSGIYKFPDLYLNKVYYEIYYYFKEAIKIIFFPG